jgi:hypothetical protein
MSARLLTACPVASSARQDFAGRPHATLQRTADSTGIALDIGRLAGEEQGVFDRPG